MKKVKIMLLSLALFAVVGGALAFKAKFNTAYCTAVWDGSSCARTCPNLAANSTTVNGVSPFVCTTIAPNADCTFEDAQGNFQTITCNASTSIKAEQ